jgi:hypothetical protein
MKNERKYNIRLEKTAGKLRFFVKGCGSPTYVRAATQAGRYALTKLSDAIQTIIHNVIGDVRAESARRIMLDMRSTGYA